MRYSIRLDKNGALPPERLGRSLKVPSPTHSRLKSSMQISSLSQGARKSKVRTEADDKSIGDAEKKFKIQEEFRTITSRIAEITNDWEGLDARQIAQLGRNESSISEAIHGAQERIDLLLMTSEQLQPGKQAALEKIRVWLDDLQEDGKDAENDSFETELAQSDTSAVAGKLEHAVVSVQKLTQKCTSSLDILFKKLIDQASTQLHDQSVNFENQLDKKRSEVDRHRSAITTLQKDKDQAEVLLAELKNTIATVNRQVELLRKDVKDMEVEREYQLREWNRERKEMQTKASEISLALSIQQTQNEQLRDSLRQSEAANLERKVVTEAASREKEKLARAEEEDQRIGTPHKPGSAELSASNVDTSAFEETIAQLTKEIEDLKEARDAAKQESFGLAEETKKLKLQVDYLESSRTVHLEHEVEQKLKTVAKTADTMKNTEEKYIAVQNENKELIEQIKALNIKLANAEEQLQMSREQVSKLQRELDDSRAAQQVHAASQPPAASVNEAMKLLETLKALTPPSIPDGAQSVQIVPSQDFAADVSTLKPIQYRRRSEMICPLNEEQMESIPVVLRNIVDALKKALDEIDIPRTNQNLLGSQEGLTPQLELSMSHMDGAQIQPVTGRRIDMSFLDRIPNTQRSLGGEGGSLRPSTAPNQGRYMSGSNTPGRAERFALKLGMESARSRNRQPTARLSSAASSRKSEDQQSLADRDEMPKKEHDEEEEDDDDNSGPHGVSIDALWQMRHLWGKYSKTDIFSTTSAPAVEAKLNETVEEFIERVVKPERRGSVHSLRARAASQQLSGEEKEGVDALVDELKQAHKDSERARLASILAYEKAENLEVSLERAHEQFQLLEQENEARMEEAKQIIMAQQRQYEALRSEFDAFPRENRSAAATPTDLLNFSFKVALLHAEWEVKMRTLVKDIIGISGQVDPELALVPKTSDEDVRKASQGAKKHLNPSLLDVQIGGDKQIAEYVKLSDKQYTVSDRKGTDLSGLGLMSPVVRKPDQSMPPTDEDLYGVERAKREVERLHRIVEGDPSVTIPPNMINLDISAQDKKYNRLLDFIRSKWRERLNELSLSGIPIEPPQRLPDPMEMEITLLVDSQLKMQKELEELLFELKSGMDLTAGDLIQQMRAKVKELQRQIDQKDKRISLLEASERKDIGVLEQAESLVKQDRALVELKLGLTFEVLKLKKELENLRMTTQQQQNQEPVEDQGSGFAKGQRSIHFRLKGLRKTIERLQYRIENIELQRSQVFTHVISAFNRVSRLSECVFNGTAYRPILEWARHREALTGINGRIKRVPLESVSLPSQLPTGRSGQEMPGHGQLKRQDRRDPSRITDTNGARLTNVDSVLVTDHTAAEDSGVASSNRQRMTKHGDSNFAESPQVQPAQKTSRSAASKGNGSRDGVGLPESNNIPKGGSESVKRVLLPPSPIKSSYALPLRKPKSSS